MELQQNHLDLCHFILALVLEVIVFQLIHLSDLQSEFDVPTRFIELAGEINTNMPRLVISKLAEALSLHAKICKWRTNFDIRMAYKKNVDDMRESPSLMMNY